MSTRITMSTGITMALVATVTAFAFPAPAVRDGQRNSEHAFKSAQYCVPEHDIPGGRHDVYC